MVRLKLRRLIDFLKRLAKKPPGVIGLTILLSLGIVAIFAPYISPYNPWEMVGAPFEPPNPRHLLGTNDVGQDILSEVIWASRISLTIGFLSALISALVGTFLGVIAGYFRGLLDRLITSITDIMLLIPSLPLMIVLAAFLGRGIFIIIFVIVITSWPSVCRMIRAQTLSISSLQYIEAAKAIGAGSGRILLKYIIPQILPLTMAVSILGTGEAMIAEAALSFLGLGDPLAKSWGTIIYWAFVSGGFTYGAWWWFVPPGALIALSVFGFMNLGYALEEELNPKLKQQQY